MVKETFSDNGVGDTGGKPHGISSILQQCINLGVAIDEFHFMSF